MTRLSIPLGAAAGRSRVLAVSLTLLALSWCGSALYCYRAGRADERSIVRDSVIARDAAVDDSLDAVRRERVAVANAALVHNAALTAQLNALTDTIAARRRQLQLVDLRHVRIVDSTGGAHVVEVPPEITARIRGDSATIDSLLDASHQQNNTIDILRTVVLADTVQLKQKDRRIADLSVPASQPPLLDRVLARVTVPMAKVALAGGAAYGIVKFAAHLIGHR